MAARRGGITDDVSWNKKGDNVVVLKYLIGEGDFEERSRDDRTVGVKEGVAKHKTEANLRPCFIDWNVIDFLCYNDRISKDLILTDGKSKIIASNGIKGNPLDTRKLLKTGFAINYNKLNLEALFLKGKSRGIEGEEKFQLDHRLAKNGVFQLTFNYCALGACTLGHRAFSQGLSPVPEEQYPHGEIDIQLGT